MEPEELFDEQDDFYPWVITTQCVTHDAQAMQEWRRQQQEFQSMGMEDEVEKPPKQSKYYQFHIKEVESVVEYDDEDFGTITVINKYNGNQVPIIEDFLKIAKIHRDYNRHRDQLLEDSFKEAKEEL